MITKNFVCDLCGCVEAITEPFSDEDDPKEHLPQGWITVNPTNSLDAKDLCAYCTQLVVSEYQNARDALSHRKSSKSKKSK